MDGLIERVLERLSHVEGLHECFVLDEDDKENIRDLEEERNHGVAEALSREVTLVVVHDSSFRDPEGEIVLKEGTHEVIFPGVPFSEVDAKNVVSGSPSKLVHHFLIERFHMHVDEEEATLLVGFDK